MVDSADKGYRAEIAVRDVLRKLTGLKWERTPNSGSLSPIHKLKGDLYIVDARNKYCVECKHYAEDHLTSKLLTSSSPQLLEWWAQAERQAKETEREPLLIFKFDRSKIFVGYKSLPCTDIKTILVLDKFFVSLLDDWIKLEKPTFTL